MSKNYDNWERLVRAVLRREWDRHIAMRQSMDFSSISSPSSSFDLSFNSTSELNLDRSLLSADTEGLPMDFSELIPLDHSNWKEMLPPDKNEFTWMSLTLRFFLDQKTGKNCFLLGVADLNIWSSNGAHDKNTRKYHPKSRFSEVAEIIYEGYLDIKSSIRTQMLSPFTHYAAYLVYRYAHNCVLPREASSSIIIRSVRQTFRTVHFEPGNDRADGWKEVELGEFYVGEGDSAEVQAELMDARRFRKGLTVEGIEFRPLPRDNRNRWSKGFFSNLRISGS